MALGRRGRAALAVGLGAVPALLLFAEGAGARAPAKSTPSPFRFVDVAPELGLTRVVLAGRPGKDHLLDSAGTGAAWLDYDRDGRLDCYVVNDWLIDGDQVTERGKNALYRQRTDGRFEDVTDEAGVGGEGEWGAGAFVADYDADGWPDILVTNFGRNVLYRNLGDGRFENVAGEVGLESPGWNTGAAWFDAEGDGDLDVYIAGYIDNTLEQILAAKPTLPWRGMAKVAVGPFGLDGGADHYFRNDGGRFVDATLEAGMEDKGLGFGFSVRAADFDRDGDLDIYVANDSDPNYLYRNEGDGTFQEVATWTGCALDENGAAQASMGVAVGDGTGNGEIDIYVNHFSEDFSTLWQGLGGGLFEDVTRRSGVGPPTYTTLAWGTAFPDLDNDGDLEIPVMNGHIYPQINDHPELIGTYEQRNILLDNRGPEASPMFVDVTEAAGPGFQQVLSSRGLALADYDDDGDLDMLLTHLDAPPSLLRNDSKVGSWLVVVCEDEKGGIIPIGTEVQVTAGGVTQWRDIASGDSYMSTHDPRPHFGLGELETVDEVVVTWPDKTTSVRKNVSARQFLRIKKGT